MTQTLRRELRTKTDAILLEFSGVLNEAQRDYISSAFADAALELRAFKPQLPRGADLGFALAAGVPTEEIAEQNAVMERETDLLNWYEAKMGYTRPLAWWTDDKLKDLRKHLVSQTKEDIETFAKWCKRPFSKFGPENAKRYPDDVITFWGLAFDKPSESNFEQEYL